MQAEALVLGLYCSGSMCVGVTLWFGWGGVVSVCRLKHLCLGCIALVRCVLVLRCGLAGVVWYLYAG